MSAEFCCKSLLSMYLGTFVKFRKVTISFVRSVRSSVRMEQFHSYWMNIYEDLYLIIFPKSAVKIRVSLKCDKNNGYFT